VPFGARFKETIRKQNGGELKKPLGAEQMPCLISRDPSHPVGAQDSSRRFRDRNYLFPSDASRRGYLLHHRV
jgi:hypothetical protein